MAYSDSRLRKTLALVRVLLGALFLLGGVHKISSLDFARIEFPRFLAEASRGAAIGFYADFLHNAVWGHAGEVALLIGFTELFIGVGLLLGLAVRPISLLGMFYALNFMLATWMAPGANEPIWRYLDNQSKLIMMFMLFLLLGIGHAGENWGVGALYHRRRHRKWVEAAEETEPEALAPLPSETSKLRYIDDDVLCRQEFGGSEFRRNPRDREL
jgi:uncharacterized membrane protein YphA (DoxX/SURF4 family)